MAIMPGTDEYVKEVADLAPSELIELFELDLAPLGGGIHRFHAGVNDVEQDIMWQGKLYVAQPVEASGFEYTGEGAMPRPIITIGNVFGTISALISEYNELIGAKVTRIRTFARFLDPVNFPGSTNPEANANVEFMREFYYVDRKAVENKLSVEYELTSIWDVQGVKLPARQIIQNTCAWLYKGDECGYTGPDVSDVNDIVVGDPEYNGTDACGKRLFSCQQRFGEFDPIPYGGFPGSSLSR